MTSRRKFLQSVSGIFGTAAIAGVTRAETSAGIQVKKDVVFHTTPERNLKLNLYLPSDREQNPAVVYAHGGGWRTGSKGEFDQHARRMAKGGYVGIDIEYRLAGEALYPAAVKDFRAAIKWLRTNDKRYNIDKSKIAATGGSAGGHLAALNSVTPNMDKFEPDGFDNDISAEIQAVVGFSGLYDLTFVEGGPPAPQGVAFLGGTYAEVPELYKEASPITHVTPDAPPTLMIHGTDDNTVPYKNAVDYRSTLLDNNVYANLFTAQGKGHRFSSGSEWKETILTLMKLFLKDQIPRNDMSKEETSTLHIMGNGNRAFYSFQTSGGISRTTGLTNEDTVNDQGGSGAVKAGRDKYKFTGLLQNLYVQDDATVLLNGNQVDPDTYESVISFKGDGSYTNYNFEVKDGIITDSVGVTSEDNVSNNSASGAVRAGSDAYHFTGTLKDIITNGSATTILNGQPI